MWKIVFRIHDSILVVLVCARTVIVRMKILVIVKEVFNHCADIDETYVITPLIMEGLFVIVVKIHQPAFHADLGDFYYNICYSKV